jgi:hypothetical protein
VLSTGDDGSAECRSVAECVSSDLNVSSSEIKNLPGFIHPRQGAAEIYGACSPYLYTNVDSSDSSRLKSTWVRLRSQSESCA